MTTVLFIYWKSLWINQLEGKTMILYEKPSITVITLNGADIITTSSNDLQKGISEKNVLPLWKDEVNGDFQ